MIQKMLRGLYVLVLSALAGTASAQTVFINELHYDNNGTDANEGVEIAGPAGTNLACYQIVLYNGADGLNYGTTTLSGTISNQCNGYGTAWFPIPNIQNGAPDAIALVSTGGAGCPAAGVIQFLSYEGSFTATGGPANGMTSTDIGVSESSTSTVGHSLQLTGSGTTYGAFTWAGSAANTMGAINTGQSFGGSCTITQFRFSSVTGCYAPGQSVPVTVCGLDASNTVLTTYSGSVTLSVASGPGSISGTTTQSAVSGCTTFNVSFSAAGTYTLTATSGAVSSTSANVYISADCNTCPHLTGVLIDACGPNEGNNEIVFMNTGNFTMPVSNAWDFNYGTVNPPPDDYNNNLVANPTYTSALNAAAGCPGLFVDASTVSVIPPNSPVMFMRQDPINVYNYAAWCGTGPIYVFYSADVNWNTSGNFKNCTDCATNGSNPRYFQLNTTTLNGGGSCNFNYNYTPCTDLLCAGDGDGVSYNYGGGGPATTWTQCTPTDPDLLPVEFADPLQAVLNGGHVLLTWTTASEEGNMGFQVERASQPQGPFHSIGFVPGMGNTLDLHAYDYTDRDPMPGMNYYRLRQNDVSGSSTFSRIAFSQLEQDRLYVNLWPNPASGHTNLEVQLPCTGRVEMRDMQGRLVWSQELAENGGGQILRLPLEGLTEGLYLVHVHCRQDSWTGKLRVQAQP